MDHFFHQTVLHGDEEIDVIIEVIDYFPGDPGRYDGPPEDCWPAEPADIEYIVWVEKHPAHYLSSLIDEEQLIKEYEERVEEWNGNY